MVARWLSNNLWTAYVMDVGGLLLSALFLVWTLYTNKEA